jgi:hypothetical protein
MTGFQEVALDRDLLDRITAVQQLALVTVDIGDGRLAAGGGQEVNMPVLAYSERISITSGPTVPDNIGNSALLPSA